MNLSILEVAPQELAHQKQAYHNTLVFPQDAYWQEGLIGASTHYRLLVGNDEAGYCAMDSENRLMQFHLEPAYMGRARDIFAQLLKQQAIDTALAATIEPRYFGLCLDHQQSASVHTYLFSDLERRDPVLKDLEGHVFRPGTDADIPAVVALLTGGDEFIDLDTVAANFGDQLGYVKMVLAGKILNVLEKDGEILGTAEFRQRADWPPYADCGMIVNPKYRRRGIGTYLLLKLKEKAYAQNLKPICSCEAGNVGSRRAVENAGFTACHRVVAFTF